MQVSADCVKGQIISKGLFGTLNSPKKQTKKFNLTSMIPQAKVIREKSRGEGSLIEQDTIENVSEPNFFFLTF